MSIVSNLLLAMYTMSCSATHMTALKEHPFCADLAGADNKLNRFPAVRQTRVLRVFIVVQGHSRSRWQVPLIPVQLPLLQQVLKLPT
jgi:hypothetical protein